MQSLKGGGVSIGFWVTVGCDWDLNLHNCEIIMRKSEKHGSYGNNQQKNIQRKRRDGPQTQEQKCFHNQTSSVILSTCSAAVNKADVGTAIITYISNVHFKMKMCMCAKET